jgi:glutamate dehydrogenase/leucine dehydrogenase
MTVYSGPGFDMAVNQFGVIANHLSIPMDERDRLLLPKPAITVSCRIHRDDGTVAVFEGYRVQHHLTLGPTKGGTRFAPSVDIGEVAALAIWMSWKCALVGLPYLGLEKCQDEIFLIPDILCNSGGVVVSYFEWVQDLRQLFWEEEEVTRREYHILDRVFDQMVMRSKADNIPHRTAAMAIGVEKVRAAKNTRGLFP